MLDEGNLEVSLLNILRTVILALSFAVIAAPAFAQLSPGDLAEAHEELEGLTNCTECHKLGEGPSNDKCLACHAALRRTMESARGYHSLQTKDQACVTCHKDHAGTDFKLITWPHGGRDKFDHTLAGYDLRGAHIKTPCHDCHNPVHHRKDLIGEESSIDPTQTFLGLDRNCLGCHRDEHRAQLGADCLKCHDPAGFKPAGQFDHSSAHFSLTGKHRQTECSKCHELLIDESASRGDTTFTKYKDIPFDGCSKCHKDKHEDKYGSRCDQCHRTSGWKNIVASAFDHSKTEFKLRGKHTEVACNKCHRSESLLGKTEHDECVTCHADRHAGQFTRREDGGRCESCHTVDSFRPAQFTIETHKKTRFEIDGAHLAQPCTGCHATRLPVTDPQVTQYTFEDRRCQACHEDTHRGQFVRSEPVKVCTACHRTDAWTIELFDHNANTKYQLVGAHQEVECKQCHFSTYDEPLMVTYRGVGTRCVDCHVNPERFEFLVEGED